MFTKNWQKTILVVFGLALSLVLPEIGLRIGGFIFLSFQENRNRASIEQKDSYRIMCLGESTTAIGGEHSYPSQLEKILNEQNLGMKFSVINKGVPGIYTNGIVSQLEDNLNKYKPDMVITMIGVNDNSSRMTYKEISTQARWFWLNSLRSYKLAKLVWRRIARKAIEWHVRLPANVNNMLKTDFKGAAKYIKLGKFYRYSGDFAQAEEAFKKAVELEPNNEDAYFNLGDCYMSHDFAQAEKAFKKAAEFNPKNHQAYLRLGLCYMNEMNFMEAEAAFRNAIQADQKTEWPYIELGHCYLRQGKLQQAEEQFKKAIEINPKNEKTYRSLTMLYRDSRQYEPAGVNNRKAEELSISGYPSIWQDNYLIVKEILARRKIKLVCVQYPVRSIEPLRKIFKSDQDIIFVDNEKIFKEALNESTYFDYFVDTFGGDFGHCTPRGNRLLAENIADAVIKEVKHERPL